MPLELGRRGDRVDGRTRPGGDLAPSRSRRRSSCSGRRTDRNVPVVLVSDIYLTGSQLATLLERAGVDMQLIDDVVTSADHRLGKAHGLLERVIADRGVEAGRVAHVGDNEIADVATLPRTSVRRRSTSTCRPSTDM